MKVSSILDHPILHDRFCINEDSVGSTCLLPILLFRKPYVSGSPPLPPVSDETSLRSRRSPPEHKDKRYEKARCDLDNAASGGSATIVTLAFTTGDVFALN